MTGPTAGLDREGFRGLRGGTGLELAGPWSDMVVFSDPNDDFAQRRTKPIGVPVRQVPAVEQGDGPSRYLVTGPSKGLDQMRSAGIGGQRWLVLSGTQQVDLDELVERGPAGVLLSPSMPGGKRSHLRRALAERSIPFHDLREQVLTFSSDDRGPYPLAPVRRTSVWMNCRRVVY